MISLETKIHIKRILSGEVNAQVQTFQRLLVYTVTMVRQMSPLVG